MSETPRGGSSLSCTGGQPGAWGVTRTLPKPGSQWLWETSGSVRPGQLDAKGWTAAWSSTRLQSWGCQFKKQTNKTTKSENK